jgi:hypothetical protein
MAVADLVGLIWLFVLDWKIKRGRKQRLGKRVDEELQKRASWMPGWMRWCVSRKVATTVY